MPEPDAPNPAWFCVRSRPKQEHIAAGHLRALPAVEVFLPRLRFRRKRAGGIAWTTEALFPNYLFARFDWQLMLRAVHHAPGVSGVLHFGERWPTIPDACVLELQQAMGGAELLVAETVIQPGDEVEVVGGALHGLAAVVSELRSGRRRVLLLMDFLGRQTVVEVPIESVIKPGDQRRVIV